MIIGIEIATLGTGCMEAACSVFPMSDILFAGS